MCRNTLYDKKTDNDTNNVWNIVLRPDSVAVMTAAYCSVKIHKQSENHSGPTSVQAQIFTAQTILDQNGNPLFWNSETVQKHKR